MALSWLSVSLTTGRVIADLPDLVVGSVKQTIMRYESQTASVPLSTAPEAWVEATRPGSAALVCLDDDGSTPLWGGMVTKRSTGHGSDVSLSLATVEAYLDRRYVGDETFDGVPQNRIVEQLVNEYARTGGKPGLPIRVQIVGGGGQVRDRTYEDKEDKTLYSVLGDLSGVIGGPEWTIGWEHVGDFFTPVLYVGDRIGAPVPAGLGPNATFSLPGPVSSAELTESYGSDDGANDVMAVSSGVADARPQSPRQTPAHYEGRPTFEYRWTPSTSITNVGTLTDHARRALAAVKDGSHALTITTNRQEAPRLGRDWGLGDDVGYDLTAPAWPDGLHGVARAIGWEIDDTTLTPILGVEA